MSFTHSKFMAMRPEARAKKLADLLRVVILRLGGDWLQARKEYDQLSAWNGEGHGLTEPLRHAEVVEHYAHWRQLAGLGMERDIHLAPDPSDLSAPAESTLDWHVLLHNLRSAHNVGSVIRTVDAFGLAGVHASGYTSPITHTAVKSAARGAEAWIPYTEWADPLFCIQHFRNHAYNIVGLETGDDAHPMEAFSWPNRGLLVVGNEELGIAPEILEQCHFKVCISMRGRKASLNVANALSIALWNVDQALRVSQSST